MYWYGWAATAAIGAIAIGIAAALLAAPTVRWRWLSWLWLAPVFRMIGCVYLILPWFRL
jgi:hypothetical protein